MLTELFRTADKLSKDGCRARYIIRQNFDILMVEFESLYGESYMEYYKKYPEIPKDLYAESSEYEGMSEGSVFLSRLQEGGKYKPFRTEQICELWKN